MNPVSLFGGFLLNLVVALLIVRGSFYPVKRDKNYVFTFLAFSTTIYFLVSFITTAEVGVGVGFGLFAIFSLLRYRTATVTTREMTYLFVLSALPVMNSLIIRMGDWISLIGANLAVVALVYALEQGWGFRYEASQRIRYDRVDLVKPENRALLIEDLRERTGLPVKRVEVMRIDLLDDTARLRVYYDMAESRHWSIDEGTVIDDL